ncbi:MAG: phosphotransferase [Rubrivivax sp.]|nr:phosphotransferase [Rubrivivax sp.]
MSSPSLPVHLSEPEFDTLHDDVPRWRPLVEPLAARHARPGESLRALDEGTVLVVLIGQRAVFKLYPPFMQGHAAFERATLALLSSLGAQPLPVATPQLLEAGEEQGWPWLLMSQLPGQVLTPLWAGLSEPDRCALLQHIGRAMAAAHALPRERVQALAPLALAGGDWAAWIAQQRAGCRARQQRTGLPTHLLDQVETFVSGPVPMPPPGETVLLTGEYTPMNLLIDPAQPDRLSGMFDFGDGLLGARQMDWLGPLVFLAAGHSQRVRALLQAYGAADSGTANARPAPEADWRLPALRLLLLHRYSNLQAQLRLPGWQTSASFEALAHRLWPLEPA